MDLLHLLIIIFYPRVNRTKKYYDTLINLFQNSKLNSSYDPCILLLKSKEELYNKYSMPYDIMNIILQKIVDLSMVGLI